MSLELALHPFGRRARVLAGFSAYERRRSIWKVEVILHMKVLIKKYILDRFTLLILF